MLARILPSARSHGARLTRSPLAWILFFVAILHVVGIGWGLPGSDGWDNDGVAPRDFLPGLAATFTPGQFYTYPPVHLAILAVLTLPVTLTALVRAPTFALADVVHEILGVPYMTAMALVARLVSVLMSLGIVLFVAQIAEEIRASELGLAPPERGGWTDERVRRAGWCTAAFVGSNATLTYYAHTSNLDVPYLFWGTWAVLQVARALARRQPRRLRWAFAFAVLAIGSKDQAYALFVLALPTAFAIWVAVDVWARAHRGRIFREATIAAGGALLLLIVVDAVVFNPSGFLARVRFLSGSASQDFVEYDPGWTGRLRILLDAARTFHLQYPAALGVGFVVGAVRTIGVALDAPRERRGAHLAVASMPLLVAASFTILFNFVARRTNARFLLPQATILAVYGGLALEQLAFSSSSPARRLVGQMVASVSLAVAFFACASVDATLVGDPRYELESWLAAHVRPGETIETYGLNVYLPRMPEGARVLRVGPERLDKRNPMPGIEEVQAPFGQARERGTRWIVVSTGWVWRYIARWPKLGPGRQPAPMFQRSTTDKEATTFFDGLVAGDQGFKLVREFTYDDRVFPLVDVHGASGKIMWVYERTVD